MAPGGTAEKCGVQKGDLIVKMNGNPAEKLTITQAQDIIKGAGNAFTMDVSRFVLLFLFN